jgi:hypothetical protein
MRKLHEQLKLMNGALPCDRYPLLKEMKRLDLLTSAGAGISQEQLAELKALGLNA